MLVVLQVERELMQQEYPGDDAHVIEMGNLGRQVSPHSNMSPRQATSMTAGPAAVACCLDLSSLLDHLRHLMPITRTTYVPGLAPSPIPISARS